MGILTPEQAQRSETFIHYNNQTGSLAVGTQDIPGVEGKLLGFGEDNFEWPKDSGKMYPKFIIYLGESNGKRYVVQLGKHTWLAMFIMNSLISIDYKANGNGVLSLILQKDGKKIQNRINYNGKKLEWKHKLTDLKFPEDKDKADAHLKKITNKWVANLIELKPYVEDTLDSPEGIEEAIGIDEENVPF